MSHRSVKLLHPARRDDIGSLVTRRPLPAPQLPQIDPFLFLNHHGPQTYPPDNPGLPFGPHPHRGFETVTFILEGELAHLDSAGYESVIHAGGVQWMTAGSGLIHAEISPTAFRRAGGPLEILQLWVNLPGRLKMTTPAYTGLQRDDLAHVELPDSAGTIHLVSGQFEDARGPVTSLTSVTMMTVQLQPGKQVVLPAPGGQNVFLYVVKGSGTIGDTSVPSMHLVELHDDGDFVRAEAGSEPMTLLYGHAPPLNEPVVAHGPFVMNTQQEITQAIRDYQSGLFGAEPDITHY